MEHIYKEWRESLKKPDDSLFYYHRSLERIVLGLTMYEIAARPYMYKLGKAKALQVYNIYINEMVTAWIYDSEEYKESFAFTFQSLMTLSEAFYITCNGFMLKHPALKKTVMALMNTFAFWTGIGGDINDELAEELLDDIATDGERIDSEKIAQIVKVMQPSVARRGLYMDPLEALDTIENLQLQ